MSSKYNGVSFSAHRNMYLAQIYYEGTNYNLGVYDLSADAALAYDVSARAAKVSKQRNINFVNESEYSCARSKELKETCLDIPRTDVVKAIKARKKQFLNNITSKNGNNCSIRR